MNTHQTKVIFRRYRDKQAEIIAVFPAIRASSLNRYLCQCYVHRGQHTSGDWMHIVAKTRPATPEEYAPLLEELRAIGYDNLLIARKATRWDHECCMRGNH